MKVSDEEKKLFRKVVGKVKRINNNSKDSDKPKPSLYVRENKENNIDSNYKIKEAGSIHSKVDGNTKLKFCKAGENNNIFKRLRQGKIRYEKTKDLHSLTVNEVTHELEEFINDCKYHGLSCVLVIHGKGLGSKEKFPIIKNKLNEFLREHPMVWGFCSAQQKHGGTGAIYLLFKKQ